MSDRALAWTGLAAGAGVVAVAGALLHRTLAVTREIARYADDIAATGDAIAANTRAGGELERLGAVAARIRALAEAGG